MQTLLVEGQETLHVDRIIRHKRSLCTGVVKLDKTVGLQGTSLSISFDRRCVTILGCEALPLLSMVRSEIGILSFNTIFHQGLRSSF
jgi:hypothetical protein